MTLQKKEPLMRLRTELLQPGDIVLTTTREPISRLIKKVTDADISHAMVCVAGSSVIDSTSEGVQARNILRFLFHKDCAVHVLRPKVPLLTEQVSTIVDYARSKIGTRYTMVGAAQSVLGFGKVRRRQFCSRLVAQAYRAAGVPLTEDADYSHPAELLRSELLLEVPDVACEASDGYVRAAEDTDDLSQRMRTVINDFLNAVRLLDSSVEDFNHVHDYLLKNPRQDDAVCAALAASGYLDVWKEELEGSPWYSIENLRNYPREQADVYAAQLLADEDLGPNRFIVNRGGYVALSTHAPLSFFAVMKDLYERLAALHAVRVEVASTYLVERGLLEPKVKLPPRPHTSEWFDALRRWDPSQAAMTEMTLKAVGTTEACTVCGDDPASDYRQPDDGATGGPGSWRLCDDCLKIRRSLHGEMLMPWPRDN